MEDTIQIPENTLEVISSARKLIFKVQDGPIVSFPEDAVINQWGQNNDTPTIVVQNCTEPDQSWQGTTVGGYVIVNEVPEDIAKAAVKIYDDAGQTNDGIQAALNYLIENECKDQYTTDEDFVSSKLTPAGMMLKNGSGIVKRDDRDICQTWQENGVYYVTPNGEARRIEPDILVRTYRNVDGEEIDLKAVPTN